MSGPRVTDHALVHLLARSGFRVDEFRQQVETSLTRAYEAAVALGGPDHLIVADGLCFVVRGGDVVTVLPAGNPRQLARALMEGGKR